MTDRRALGRLMDGMPAADAVPRRNDDLAFDNPWEIRAFGLAVAAHQEGHFAWPDFQGELIDAIRRWEDVPDGEWRYYSRWLEALEHLVVERGLVDPAEIGQRAAEFAPGGPRDPKHPK